MFHDNRCCSLLTSTDLDKRFAVAANQLYDNPQLISMALRCIMLRILQSNSIMKELQNMIQSTMTGTVGEKNNRLARVDALRGIILLGMLLVIRRRASTRSFFPGPINIYKNHLMFKTLNIYYENYVSFKARSA